MSNTNGVFIISSTVDDKELVLSNQTHMQRYTNRKDKQSHGRNV